MNALIGDKTMDVVIVAASHTVCSIVGEDADMEEDADMVEDMVGDAVWCAVRRVACGIVEAKTWEDG